ncbi:hypothetical protein H4R35_003450 [Dimargaris xerosporica]|nr:hypothetical protein H4R35_003450 [Dimargaris xerosporica]
MYGNSPSQSILASHAALSNPSINFSQSRVHHPAPPANAISIRCQRCQRLVNPNARDSGLCPRCSISDKCALRAMALVPHRRVSPPPLPAPPINASHMSLYPRDDLDLARRSSYTNQSMMRSHSMYDDALSPHAGMLATHSTLPPPMGHGMVGGPHPSHYSMHSQSLAPVPAGPLVGNSMVVAPHHYPHGSPPYHPAVGPLMTSHSTLAHCNPHASSCSKAMGHRLPHGEMEYCVHSGTYHFKNEHPNRAAAFIDSVAGSAKKLIGSLTGDNELLVEGIDEQNKGRRRTMQADSLREINRVNRQYYQDSLMSARREERLMRRESRRNEHYINREEFKARFGSRYL